MVKLFCFYMCVHIQASLMILSFTFYLCYCLFIGMQNKRKWVVIKNYKQTLLFFSMEYENNRLIKDVLLV
ncbi:hypothetical protein CN327_01265 [Bacillus cereus]|nr:hypothetical protein CN327_01265 [Bacillus cereus]